MKKILTIITFLIIIILSSCKQAESTTSLNLANTDSNITVEKHFEDKIGIYTVEDNNDIISKLNSLVLVKVDIKPIEFKYIIKVEDKTIKISEGLLCLQDTTYQISSGDLSFLDKYIYTEREDIHKLDFISTNVIDIQLFIDNKSQYHIGLNKTNKVNDIKNNLSELLLSSTTKPNSYSEKLVIKFLDNANKTISIIIIYDDSIIEYKDNFYKLEKGSLEVIKSYNKKNADINKESATLPWI